MKRFILFTFFVCFFLPGISQETKKSRKEIRAERKTQKKNEVKALLDSKNYVFKATHVQPLGGSQIYLTSSYDLTISGDSAKAFLPYFGVAFQIDYGERDGGIKFDERIREYSVKETKTGKLLSIEVKAPKDIYFMTLSVTDEGKASLNVICNKRQPVQFYGMIEEK